MVVDEATFVCSGLAWLATEPTAIESVEPRAFTQYIVVH